MVKRNTKHNFFGLLKNPVVLSAIFCVLLIYSRPAESYYIIKSLFPEKNIVVLKGTFSSSPVKQKSFYNVKLKTEIAQDSEKNTTFCSNFVNVFIPSAIVELWYPGKLFTENIHKSGINAERFLLPEPIEEGILAIVYGSFDSNHNFYAKKIKTFSKLNESKWSFKYTLVKFRAKCRLQLKRLLFAWGEAGGLLLALLAGSREYAGEELSLAFKNAGLSHIMALSGMHLSLFSGIAFFLGKKLKSKNIAFILRFFFILFFVWFAGFTPSLFRAFLCSLLTLFAGLSKSEKSNSLKILCLAFLIHAFVFPKDLFTQAFILSYGAITGILLFSNYVKPYVSRKFPSFISSNVSSSIGAQAITTPYTIAVFKVFVPFCTLATLIVSPLITIFIYSGVILICLSFVLPFLSPAFGGIIQLVYGVIKWLVIFFAKLPAVHV